MATVAKVMGEWFGYGRTRILGPFKSEGAAWRELREADEL